MAQSVITVGLNERDILSRDLKCKKSIVYLKDIPSLYKREYHYGFVKLLVDHSNHLIGATIVAPNAKSIVGELSLCLNRRLTIEALAFTPHLADSSALAISEAAKKLLK